jgi:hypothetical protein
MVPGVIKRSKTVSIQKAQREHGGKRLGWHRDGNQPVAGPHPDLDTSYETWVIRCKSTRNKKQKRILLTFKYCLYCKGLKHIPI